MEDKGVELVRSSLPWNVTSLGGPKVIYVSVPVTS